MHGEEVVQRYQQQLDRCVPTEIGRSLSLADAQKLLQWRAQLVERLCAVRELQGSSLRAQAEILRTERDYEENEDPVVQMDVAGRKRIAEARVLHCREMIRQYALEVEVFRALMAPLLGEVQESGVTSGKDT